MTTPVTEPRAKVITTVRGAERRNDHDGHGAKSQGNHAGQGAKSQGNHGGQGSRAPE
jgi:hypothetical protein